MLTAGQKMMNKIKKYLEFGRELLSSLLFPKRCPVCDEILEPEETKKGIHSACESKLYPILGAVCMHCGRPIGDENHESSKEYCYDCIRNGYHVKSFITQAKSLYVYKGAIKKSMYRLKYSNKREYGDYFAKRAVEKYAWWIKQAGIDVIVPVPMYKRKQRRRGYNQAEVFASKIAGYAGIKMDANLVCRIRDTAPQKQLTSTQRRNNLKNAFQKRKNVVQCGCAMVVDDIYTTGSTAEAVAQQLIKQGIHRVYLMTICIGGDV